MAAPQQRTLTDAPVTLAASPSLINSVVRSHQNPSELYAKLSDSNGRVVISQTGSNHHVVPRPASRRPRPCSLCGTTAVRSQSGVIPGSPLGSNEQPVVLLHRLEDGLPQGDVNSLRAYGTIRLLPVHSSFDSSNQEYDSDHDGEVHQREVNHAMAHAVYHSDIRKEEASRSRAQYSPWGIGSFRESKYSLSDTNSLHRSEERYLASKVEQTNLCRTQTVNSGFNNCRIHSVKRDSVPHDREERGGPRVQQQKGDVSERGGKRTEERGDSGYHTVSASPTFPPHTASQPRPSSKQRHHSSSSVNCSLSPVSSETSNALLTHASPDSSTPTTTHNHNHQSMSCQSLRQSDLTQATTTNYVPTTTSSQFFSSLPHHHHHHHHHHHTSPPPSSSPPSSSSVHSSCHQQPVVAPSSPYTPMSVLLPFSASSPAALSSSSSPSSSRPLLSPPSPSSISPPGSPPSPPSSPFSLNSPLTFTESSRTALCHQNLPPSSPYSPRSLSSSPHSPTSLPSRSASPPSPSPSLGSPPMSPSAAYHHNSSCPSLDLYQGHLYSHAEGQTGVVGEVVHGRLEEEEEDNGDTYTSSLTPSPVSSRLNSSLRSSSALSSERDTPEDKKLFDSNNSASASYSLLNSTKASSLHSSLKNAAAAAAAHNQHPREVQTHARLTDKAKVQTMWNEVSGSEDASVRPKLDAAERTTCAISQTSQVISKCSESRGGGGCVSGAGASCGDGAELEGHLNDYNSKSSSSSMKLVLKVKNPSTQPSPTETEKKDCNKENGIPKIVLTRTGNGPNREYSCSNRLRNEDQRLANEVVQNKKHKSKKSKRDKLKIKKIKKFVKSDKHKRHLELFGEDSNDSCEMATRFQVSVNGLPEETKVRKEQQVQQQKKQQLRHSTTEEEEVDADEEEEEEEDEEQREGDEEERKGGEAATSTPPGERHQRDYQLPLSFPTLGESPGYSGSELLPTHPTTEKEQYAFSVNVESVCNKLKHDTTVDSVEYSLSDSLPDLDSPPHTDHIKKELECTVSQSPPVEQQEGKSVKQVELRFVVDELIKLPKQGLSSLESHVTKSSNPDTSDDSSLPSPSPQINSHISSPSPSPVRRSKQKSTNKTVSANSKKLLEPTVPRSKRDRCVKKTISGSNSDACLWVSFGMNAPVPLPASDMDLSPLRSLHTRRESSDSETQSFLEFEELPDLCSTNLNNSDQKHSHENTECEGKHRDRKQSSSEKLNKDRERVPSKRSYHGTRYSRSSQSRLRSSRGEVKRPTRSNRSYRARKRGSGHHRARGSGRKGRSSWRRGGSPLLTGEQSETSLSSKHSHKQSSHTHSISYSPTHSSTHPSGDSKTSHSAIQETSETLEGTQEDHTDKPTTENTDHDNQYDQEPQQPTGQGSFSDTNVSTEDQSTDLNLNASHTTHGQGQSLHKNDTGADHQTAAVQESETITQNQNISVGDDQGSNHRLSTTCHNLTHSKNHDHMQHQNHPDPNTAQDLDSQNLNSKDLNTPQSQTDTQDSLTTHTHFDSHFPEQNHNQEDSNSSQNLKSIQGENTDVDDDVGPQEMINQEVLSQAQVITPPDLNSASQTFKSPQDQITHRIIKPGIAIGDSKCQSSDIDEATSGKSIRKSVTDEEIPLVDQAIKRDTLQLPTLPERDQGTAGVSRALESMAMHVTPSQLCSSSSSSALSAQSEGGDGGTSSETLYYRPKKIRKVDHHLGSVKTSPFNNSIVQHSPELNNTTTPETINNSATTPGAETNPGMNLSLHMRGKDSEVCVAHDLPLTTQELSTPRPVQGWGYASEASRVSNGCVVEIVGTEHAMRDPEPVIQQHQAPQTLPVPSSQDQSQPQQTREPVISFHHPQSQQQQQTREPVASHHQQPQQQQPREPTPSSHHPQPSQQPPVPATSHHPHQQQSPPPLDPPTLTSHSQHDLPEKQMEQQKQKQLSRSESKAGKSEVQTETGTGKRDEASDKGDSPSRKSLDSNGSEGTTHKKGRKRITRKDRSSSGGGKTWALQEALHRREVQHEEERGKRLAQEIKGFNWLEEKIKNGSIHPPPPPTSTATASAGSGSGSSNGHSASSSCCSSPLTPNTPKDPPQRTLSSTSNSSSSSAEPPSTPQSPSCSKFVFTVNRKNKDEGDFKKSSSLSVGSSSSSSGLKGHLQIAVPPLAPSSRVTALPKRRPTPPTPTTPTPTHNNNTPAAAVPTTPTVPYSPGGHTMTVRSPLFSTLHSHQEQGGSGIVRSVGGGPPALAKSGAFYDYHNHLSDSNKATLYSTTSHTKATLYGVHDDSLELFYDSVKGNNGNSYDDAQVKSTATNGSHSASSGSPVSNIYCSVQGLIATPPAKLPTSSSTEDPTPSTTPSANTTSTALNATPSTHPYHLVWQQQQQQHQISVSSHLGPTSSSEPKRFSHKHTLLRRCFRELLKSESESSPEPPINEKSAEPDLNVSQMCSEVRESEPEKAVLTCSTVTATTTAADPDTSVDKPSMVTVAETDCSTLQPQPSVNVTDSHLPTAETCKTKVPRAEETLTSLSSPDSALPAPPVTERRSSLSVNEEHNMSFQAMIKTELLDSTVSDNDESVNKEVTPKSECSKLSNTVSNNGEPKKPETSKSEIDAVEDVSKSICSKVIESITDESDLEVKYLKGDVKYDPTKGKEDSEIQSNLILSVLYKELMRTRQEVEKLRRVQELMLTEKGDKKEHTEVESKAESKPEDSSMDTDKPENEKKCEKRKHEDAVPQEDSHGADSASKKSKISIRSDLLLEVDAPATTTSATALVTAVQDTPTPSAVSSSNNLQQDLSPPLPSTTTVPHPTPQQSEPETIITLDSTDQPPKDTIQEAPVECPVQPRLSPGVVKPCPILPKVGAVLPGSSPGLPRASPGVPRGSHGAPAVSPGVLSGTGSRVLPMSSPTLPRSSPGMPSSSPGMARSSPGMPRTSPGVPISSPGVPVPLSSPSVTRASPVILQIQHPPVTSPTSVILPLVSPTAPPPQVSPHASRSAGPQAAHTSNFSVVTSAPQDARNVTPKQPYEQSDTSPTVSQPMPPPIASIVLGNPLCSPTGTRVSPVVSRTSPVITKTNSLPCSTVSTSDAVLSRSLSPNKLRTAFGISNSEVELMPVSVGSKPSYPEPYPQTFLKLNEHQQDAGNPILLNAFKGLRVHTKDGGEIPHGQLPFRLPQDDPRRSLHAQPYETEIRRTAHSTSELPDFPSTSRKPPPPLKPASSLVRRHSDTLDPRTLNPALHRLMYPSTTHPSLVGSTHPQKTIPISSYSHPPQSNQTQYPQVTQSGRRNSDVSCSERSRECRMAIGLQHQYPQHMTPVTGMMSLGPDKATIFPITPMAPSIRPFKNTPAPAPMRSAMEPYQNENFLRSNLPFFEKLRENIQQARDTSLSVSDRGHLGQERLQPAACNIDKPQQPQTFAPRVLVQESGPKAHVPPSTYPAPHFSTPSHQHIPGVMTSHPGHFPNTMHSGASLHHLPQTGLPPTNHQSVPPVRPNNANNARSNNEASRSEKKQCLNCPQQARFLCSGCKKAWYCSEQCQRDHWIAHNTACTQ